MRRPLSYSAHFKTLLAGGAFRGDHHNKMLRLAFVDARILMQLMVA
nr:hypothetical protein [Escherichia coli]